MATYLLLGIVVGSAIVADQKLPARMSDIDVFAILIFTFIAWPVMLLAWIKNHTNK